MNKSNSIEAIDKTNWTNQTKFRLDEISKIENCFIKEINQRKLCSKKLSKYVAAFDCIDQAIIFLSATSGGVSIISFPSIVGAPVGIASASIILFFSLTTGIVTKLRNITRKKEKKKHDKILMLAKSKLNIIETLISKALIDIEISHAEFITILNQKGKCERMKENLRSKNEKYEIVRLRSVKLKTKYKNKMKTVKIIEYFMPSKKNYFFLVYV